MKYDFSYSLTAYDFSNAACDILYACLSSLPVDRDVFYTAEMLKFDLLCASAESQEDHAQFGHDLNYPKNDSPEMPERIRLLAERVGELPDYQAHAIRWAVAGFWDGVRAKQAEIDGRA